MNYIEIDLSKPGTLVNYDRVAGKQGESYVRGVKFTIPPEYLEWDIYVETENANGEARRYSINDIQDNIVVYKFRKKDLEAKGRLLLDLVLENRDMVFKPFSGEFAVKFAICATDTEWDDDIEVDMTGYALKADIPRSLSELKNDLGFITAKELNQSVDETLQNALDKAKESGEFDGYTPIKGVDYFDGAKGDPFTYEDFTSEQLESLKGAKGDPYELTEADKAEIKQSVLEEMPETDLGGYEKTIVTPQMYGAVGDGISDDTDAFQAAVDSGYPVLIPSGEYLVANVYITKPITIKGGGYPRLKYPIEKYRVGDSYQPLSIFYCKGGTAEGEEGVNGVIIEGIHFDGNCKAICEAYYEAEGLTSPDLMANVPTHSSGVIIRDRSKNITIKDCQFDDFKDAGVAIEKCSKQVTVENCIIGEEGWHGYGYNKGIVASLSQYGGSAEIEDISGYFIFKNNRIFNCGEHGINIYSSYNHCVIEGNFIKDCGLMYDNPDPNITGGVLTWGYCIKTSGGADLLVTNNTCVCGMANGIGLMGDTKYGNTGDMRIIGNHVIGSDGENSKCSGIQCENVAGAIISNNIIENIRIHSYAGVYGIRSTCGSLITNNIIKNCDRGIGVNVHGDTSDYAEIPNTQVCDNTIIASMPLILSQINGANISNNYIKGSEGVISVNGEDVAGIIINGGRMASVNNNILCDLPLGINVLKTSDVIISETIFSNVNVEYNTSSQENANIIIRQDDISYGYELIEEKTVLTDDIIVTTSKPSDWDKNYQAYCINTGTNDEPIFTPITDTAAPEWEAGKYYLNGLKRIDYKFDADKFDKMLAVCSVSDKATVSGSVYIGFYCDTTSKELFYNAGVTAKDVRYFYASADVSEGILMPICVAPSVNTTSRNLFGTPTPTPVSSKISRILLQAGGSGFPIGTTVKIYGVKSAKTILGVPKSEIVTAVLNALPKAEEDEF